jgi:hypothetical protein
MEHRRNLFGKVLVEQTWSEAMMVSWTKEDALVNRLEHSLQRLVLPQLVSKVLVILSYCCDPSGAVLIFN